MTYTTVNISRLLPLTATSKVQVDAAHFATGKAKIRPWAVIPLKRAIPNRTKLPYELSLGQRHLETANSYMKTFEKRVFYDMLSAGKRAELSKPFDLALADHQKGFVSSNYKISRLGLIMTEPNRMQSKTIMTSSGL